MASLANRRVLPGFRMSLSFTLMYLAVLIVVPLIAVLARASSMTLADFMRVVWTPQARAAYALTFGASFIAAIIDVILGVLLAWVLVRYEFPGKRILDSLIDLPFALPTAVAGLVYSTLYAKNGWMGQFLVPLGIHAAYSRLAVVLVLVFIGLPFVVRALEPVLESLDPELEEASACLGASRWTTVWCVVLPHLYPAMLTGFTLTLARGIGEYGSVVFVSGNKPFETEIAPYLIVQKLEAFQYKEATAIATVLLAASFALLIAINFLERRSASRAT
jgi:sulfate/thiosulfate transport system permease protein